MKLNDIIEIMLLYFVALIVCGCSTTLTTTVTEYDDTGRVVKTTETVSDISDFSCLVASGEGNATMLSADVSKFNLGWNGYGLNWLSVSGVRVKAPVKNGSNSSEALDKTAEVIKSTKTNVKVGELEVNKEPTETLTKDKN